jgi:hypothetical protein
MGLFGLGDGKMDLQLKNASVAPGETLEGTATLTLNNDVKGKEVVAILFAERTERYMNNGHQESRNVQVYSKAETLDTEKLYTKQNGPYQYHFTFVIPQTGASIPAATSQVIAAIGALVSAMGALTPIRWYVKVELKHDAMLTFAIAKTQEINILAQPQQAQPAPGQI